jgi:hypothetical protein
MIVFIDINIDRQNNKHICVKCQASVTKTNGPENNQVSILEFGNQLYLLFDDSGI